MKSKSDILLGLMVWAMIKSKPTEIDVRVNDGEWIHIDGVPLTDSWNTVSVVSKRN